MQAQNVDDHRRISLEFRGTDAMDATQRRRVTRPKTRDLAQRAVGEDHIRRDFSLAGEIEAASP